jgi:hypothetical protein
MKQRYIAILIQALIGLAVICSSALLMRDYIQDPRDHLRAAFLDEFSETTAFLRENNFKLSQKIAQEAMVYKHPVSDHADSIGQYMNEQTRLFEMLFKKTAADPSEAHLLRLDRALNAHFSLIQLDPTYSDMRMAAIFGITHLSDSILTQSAADFKVTLHKKQTEMLMFNAQVLNYLYRKVVNEGVICCPFPAHIIAFDKSAYLTGEYVQVRMLLSAGDCTKKRTEIEVNGKPMLLREGSVDFSLNDIKPHEQKLHIKATCYHGYVEQHTDSLDYTIQIQDK